MNEKNKMLLKKLGYYFGVGLAVLFILSVVFSVSGLYPFGNGTVAWCDMTQQVIPMTADLKDILTGKTGLLLNLQNAGGMSMIGVIFFFVASPFNLLALLVPKTDLVYLVNILTMLKMTAAGITAALFFDKCFKKTGLAIKAALSVSYAFCGYGILYYQNNIWLDIMYLFPLLMLGINSLVTKKKLAPYVVTMSLMAAVNYYICYMVALFCILYFALLCVRDRKKEQLHTGILFITGSLIAMLLTAVIWLPSLLQFFSSARTTSIKDNLVSASFLTEFQTTLPLLMYSAVAVVIIAVCIGDKKKHSRYISTTLIMLGLMLVPMLVEPVNLMWHTGSYMSFPCRFAFITVFLMLIVCAGFLEEGSEHICADGAKIPASGKAAAGAVGVGLTIVCALLVKRVMKVNEETINTYSRKLWSDDTSLGIETKVFAVVAVCFLAVFLLYKKGALNRRLFSVLLCGFVAVEAFASVGMYMTGSKDYSFEKANATREVYALEGKIDDDSFYRVKTTAKQFDVNNIGGLGYRSLSHYTSLTDKNYMYTMKRLGYSSYWMEVGSHGGTELTDALFSVKYKIGLSGLDDNTVYTGKKYGIYERDSVIGLGLVTDRDISSMESLEGLDRFEVQQGLYRTLFAKDGEDEIMTRYEHLPTGQVIISEEDGVTEVIPMKVNGTLIYDINVKGEQTLYFDCFDKASSNLYERINDSFTVTVNDLEIQSKYPSQSSNGLLKLGDFKDCEVRVEIEVHNNLMCTSFGVYGLDRQKLKEAVSSVRCAGLNEERGVITGNYTAAKGEKCVLFIPYSKTLQLEINGEKANFEKAFGDFIAFDLKEGENSIRLTNSPMGIVPGIVLTVLGALLCVGVYFLRKKVKFDETVCGVLRMAVIAAGVAAFILVYICPVVINCIGTDKK